MSEARHRLRCRPAYLRGEAWYPSKALLKRIRDDGWSVVCRLQKPRRGHGLPWRAYRRHPDWAETGWLSGGVTVLVVRDGATYDATHRLTRPAAEVRQVYRVSAHMAEVIRVGQDQLGLRGCQARSARAHLHQMSCCFGAFFVLEQECHMRGLSIYKRKRRLSCQGHTVTSRSGATQTDCVTPVIE